MLCARPEEFVQSPLLQSKNSPPPSTVCPRPSTFRPVLSLCYLLRIRPARPYTTLLSLLLSVPFVPPFHPAGS